MELKRAGTLSDSGSYALVPLLQGGSSEEEFNPDQLRALEIVREKKSNKPEIDWSQMSHAIEESESFAAEFVKEYDNSLCCILL